jgi:hypothetical protein
MSRQVSIKRKALSRQSQQKNQIKASRPPSVARYASWPEFQLKRKWGIR